MGLFNFFGDNEHRVFNYKPMYYDKDAEERKRKFGAVDGSADNRLSVFIYHLTLYQILRHNIHSGRRQEDSDQCIET